MARPHDYIPKAGGRFDAWQANFIAAADQYAKVLGLTDDQITELRTVCLNQAMRRIDALLPPGDLHDWAYFTQFKTSSAFAIVKGSAAPLTIPH